MASALAPGSVRFLGTLAGNVGRSPERALDLLTKRHEEIADNALAVLGELRGGAMKVGQLASFVDVSLLPPEHRAIYQEKLGRLRDAAPPMPWADVRRVLDREWEEDVESIFEDFDHDAAAAASVGQVHRATLPGGRAVAVKVQYPQIADAVASDLDLLGVGLRLARLIAPGLDPRVVGTELRERILEELDYEIEAQNQRTFARAYRGHPFIHVPAVVSELSRRRVLVSDWVDGDSFDGILEQPQEERDRIGEVIQRFYFGSMHTLGRFNTDPHPGNFLRMPDGRVAFLDFGNVKAVDPDWLAASVRTITALIGNDRETFRRELEGLGYLRDAERADVDRLMRQALATGDWFLSDREICLDPEYLAALLAELTNDAAESLRSLRELRVPPEDIWLRRVSVSVAAVLAKLRACRNWHRIAREMWFGDPPSTPLGSLDREFWEARGLRR
jgi:predicted unusual protein kinase regulating ubiquinone biosynthesis (AarF/ABC1/UbiB family)